MADDARAPQPTVEDALAGRVETRRGGGAVPVAAALRELGAVYQAIAQTPTPTLDAPLRRLSSAANRSRLWLGRACAGG